MYSVLFQGWAVGVYLSDTAQQGWAMQQMPSAFATTCSLQQRLEWRHQQSVWSCCSQRRPSVTGPHCGSCHVNDMRGLQSVHGTLKRFFFPDERFHCFSTSNEIEANYESNLHDMELNGLVCPSREGYHFICKLYLRIWRRRRSFSSNESHDVQCIML